GQSGLKVELDLDDELPEQQLDAGRLRQMLHNMIKNAQEAGETEGQEPGISSLVRITTRCSETQRWGRFVELIIEDDGPGLGDDVTSNLYEPYVTNKTKGTGLGLAIVKKIVEEHNGRIRHDRSPLGGVRFSIQFALRGESTT
ncbi:MAG: sensor histidine kinase, partial [Gammaproteobacteria bacterium]